VFVHLFHDESLHHAKQGIRVLIQVGAQVGNAGGA
jgi:hypothetical protein